MLLYLQGEGVRYRPDVAVLGYVSIDGPRNEQSWFGYAKPHFVLSNGRLKLEGVPVLSPREMIAAEWHRLRLVDLFTMVRERLRPMNASRQRALDDLTTALLDSFVTTARQAGAEPVIAELPVLGELLDTAAAPNAAERLVGGVCARRQLHCIDLRQPIARLVVAHQLPSDTVRHWAPAVHRAVAEALKSFLEAEVPAFAPQGASPPRCAAANPSLGGRHPPP